MMGMGSVDMRELVKLQENLKKLEDEAKRQQFCEASAKKLAARLLTYVIKRTPVGNYPYEVTATAKRDGKKHKKGEQYTKRINPSGRKGGVLRRGWISKTPEEAAKGGRVSMDEILAYVNGVQVKKSGKQYIIEIKNPIEYASYVEYGHVQTPGRYVPALGKRLKKAWVPGKLMMTKSENDVKRIAPKQLEAEFYEFLKGAFND